MRSQRRHAQSGNPPSDARQSRQRSYLTATLTLFGRKGGVVSREAIFFSSHAGIDPLRAWDAYFPRPRGELSHGHSCKLRPRERGTPSTWGALGLAWLPSTGGCHHALDHRDGRACRLVGAGHGAGFDLFEHLSILLPGRLRRRRPAHGQYGCGRRRKLFRHGVQRRRTKIMASSSSCRPPARAGPTASSMPSARRMDARMDP